MEWKRKEMPADHDPWDGEWEGEYRNCCYEMFIYNSATQCDEYYDLPWEHCDRFFVDITMLDGANQVKHVVLGPLDHEQPIEHGHAWAKSMIDDWHSAREE